MIQIPKFLAVSKEYHIIMQLKNQIKVVHDWKCFDAKVDHTKLITWITFKHSKSHRQLIIKY